MLKDQVSSRMKNQSEHESIEENPDTIYQSRSSYIPFLPFCVSSPTLDIYPLKIFTWNWTSTYWDSSVISRCPWLDTCQANKLSHSKFLEIWRGHQMTFREELEKKIFPVIGSCLKNWPYFGVLHLLVRCSRMDLI